MAKAKENDLEKREAMAKDVRVQIDALAAGERSTPILLLTDYFRFKLPLSEETLVALMNLVVTLKSDWNFRYLLPWTGVASAMENRVADGPLSAELATSLRAAIDAIYTVATNNQMRTIVDRLKKCDVAVETPPAPIKQGISPEIVELTRELVSDQAGLYEQNPAREKLLRLDRNSQADAVGQLFFDILARHQETRRDGYIGSGGDRSQYYRIRAIQELMQKKLSLSDVTLIAMLDVVELLENLSWLPVKINQMATAMENRAARGPMTPELLKSLQKATSIIEATAFDAEQRKAGTRLAKLLRENALAQGNVDQPIIAPRISSGEAWSDVALADLAAMEKNQLRAWSALLVSCQDAGTGKPTAKWLKEARDLTKAVGLASFKHHVTRWFPLVDKPRTAPQVKRNEWERDTTHTISPAHIDLLKGLATCASFEADRDVARALGGLAQSAYRKIPGVGPRHVSLGHAVINALGAMPGMDAVGQLALLKVKIKFIPAQKEIDKALTAAAEREGLPRDEVEELAVPTYGMDEVGKRTEEFGDYVAEMIVEGQDAAIHWKKASDGKPIKAVPAAVKKDFADDLKELQAAAKDVGKMLTAQRERIDSLFLAQKKWPLEAWRERYLDHPLVGNIARRLIWQFATDDKIEDGIWLNEQIIDCHDQPLKHLNETTTVALWHPIGFSIETISAWRNWLDRHQVRQPFKQAHREVYVLTDAERNTRVYSNRFAAHVLRQHQYHALCGARGWRDKLRLMVDDSYPPTSKELPGWSLRAEFWVEGLGDQYGTDSTDSGAYLYLGTDQVRFYEAGAAQRLAHASGGGFGATWGGGDAEPVPLANIPALVLSEILRDVDLFVGVASVGNDPTWSDGGPDGRYVNYWTGYSFGDLTANGKTRKAVLERLIPRLKIAKRCSFSDKFLVVNGDLRTYKIHLGSGNILMEPNDQYLCIVPKRSENATTGVLLPFEGDNTLSIILSKALMLAEDKKITDTSIVSQIMR